MYKLLETFVATHLRESIELFKLPLGTVSVKIKQVDESHFFECLLKSEEYKRFKVTYMDLDILEAHLKRNKGK